MVVILTPIVLMVVGIPGYLSGQISSRRHMTSPKKVAFWKGNGTPAISGKSR